MNNLIKNLKKNNFKNFHIFLIILGSIFLLLSNFHSNIWFDESYSVGMASHTFIDIWNIGRNDVHPIFYYFCLHILNLIFGDKIIIYRLFSILCTILLGILGFSHIRKDFGEKTGLFFTFLVFFFPPCLVYSGELRMYSLAMLLVTLTFIYAFRIYKNLDENYNLKNWILFAIFSLISAYTHYYALLASGLINLFLMITLIIKFIKTKKFDKNMKSFIISGIIQIILYLPWLLALLLQIGNVSSGFWISLSFPDTLIELFTFQFTGNLISNNYINTFVAIFWSLFVTIYMIYLYTKGINKQIKSKNNPATLALKIFLGVAICASIVSLIIRRPIIYARYMLCVMGLFIFFLAYTMDKKGNKYFNLILCIISLLISLYININFINVNYDKSNFEPLNYINQDISDSDIFILDKDLNGLTLSVNYKNNIPYFYNDNNWNIEKAYKAFSDDFKSVYDFDFLENYSGKIWIINNSDYSIYEKIKNQYNDIKLIKQEKFNIKYKNYQYTISLIEKN